MQADSRDSISRQPVLCAVEALFRHRRLFLAVLSTVVVLVAAVTLLSPRLYRSDMKFLLENNRSTAVITSDRSAPPVVTEITEQQINSELEVLGSEDVLDSVADPEWNALPSAARTPARMKQHENRIKSFRAGLELGSPRRSNVIAVSYTAPSAVEATQTLQRFSTAYLAHRKRLSRPGGTVEFFADQAARYKEAWQQANKDLVAFQQKNQLVSVQDTEQTLSRDIANAEENLRATQASLAEMDHRLTAGGKAAAEVPQRQQTQQHTILSQTSVDQMRTLLVQLQNRRTELLTRYTPSDRLVTELDREIADTNASLSSALAQKGQEDTTDVNPAWQQVNSLMVEGAISRQALLGRSQALRQSLAQLRGRMAKLQSMDLHFTALQQQADQAHSNFKLFSEKRDQAQIEDAMDDRQLINIAIAQTPTSRYRPVSPKPLLNGALGLLTGLFLAAGAVYFAESARTTVASARELELLSRYPVMAAVPLVELETDIAPALGRAPQTVGARLRDPLSAVRIIPALQKFREPNEA